MLEIQQLSKRFRDVQALDHVSFNAKPGRILGLIGQNGAGKSTTFHSILRFLDYQGTILLDGHNISDADFNQIGYLPEERSLMPKMTIKQQVLYLEKLKGRSKQFILQQLPDWMKTFEVKGTLKTKIKQLSKGNQQKVQLICTLLHKPQLVILDEPFSGLDPINAELLKVAIIKAKQRGAIIIFSSHNMNNVQELCDDLVMLKNGQVVLNGTIDSIRNRFGKNELFVTTPMPLEALKSLSHVDQVIQRGNDRYLLRLDDPNAGKELFQAISHGEYIEEFSQQPPSLDEIFRMEVEKNE